jgi:tetratricopeptide (TPR) repeat protein
MVSRRPLLGLALLAVALGGCAGLRPAADGPAPTLNAGVPTAEQLAAPYRAQAEQLERAGRLREAVEAWMSALAFAPGHEPSRHALKRLRERIDREVAEQLRQGWHALARDGAAEARRHFLAALALDPDSRAAQEALRATPAPPEPKPTGLAVRPAVLTATDPRLADSSRPRPEARGTAKPEARGGDETEKPESLYAAAKAHLAAGRDDEAYRALTQLARVGPGYRDSAALLRDLRARLARQRYQEGLRLFREELIEAAIVQWRAVLELDPRHVDARRSIEQAEKMLHTLAAQPKR